jgi:hypothetical protein
MKGLKLLLYSLFFVVTAFSQTVVFSLDDSPNPSSGTVFYATAKVVGNMSSADHVYLDVSLPWGISDAQVENGYEWDDWKVYKPGDKIHHRISGEMIAKHYLISAHRTGYSAQDLRLKIKFTPNMSGEIQLYGRATIGTKTDPADGKGQAKDQQGWDVYVRKHTHQGEIKPDLQNYKLTVNNENPFYEGQLVDIDEFVKELGGKAVSSFKVTFYVDGGSIGSKTTSITASGSKTVTDDYTFSSVKAYKVKAVIDPDGLISESDETNNSREISVTPLKNNAPSVNITGTTVNPDNGVTVNWSGSDPDGHSVSYRWWIDSNTPSEWSGSKSATISGPIASGSHTFYVQCKDEIGKTGNTDSEQFSIVDVNQPPVLNSISKKTITEGEEVQIQLSATDPNGDVLTYSMPNNSPGDLNSSTGLYKWKPALGKAGIYQIAFSVSDGRGGTDSETAEIEVKSAPTGSVDSWPISGNNIRVSLQPNSEFLTEIIMSPGQEITSWLFGFNPSAGNKSSSFLLTVISPSGEKQEHPFSSTSATMQTNNTEKGTWKLILKNSSTEIAELLLRSGVESPKLIFQTVIYRKGSAPMRGLTKLAGSSNFWSVSWGVVSGVCSDEDWMCMSADLAVGFVPVVGTAKDLIQLTAGTLVGSGMEAVAFFTNDEATGKKADEYFSSAGFALIGIGATAVIGGYYVDEAAKVAKYGPRIAKLAWFSKKAIRLKKLPPSGEYFYKNSGKVKDLAENSRYYLDKAIATTDEGKAFEYDMMAKFLSDPGKRFEAVKIAGGDGVGTKFYAKMVPGGDKLPSESIEKWDYSTVSLVQKNSDYHQVTDLDVLVKDKQTGKLVGVQVKSGPYEPTELVEGEGVWGKNSKQLELFRRSIKGSEEFRKGLGGNTVDDFESFGILGTNLAIHPKVTGNSFTSASNLDTVFVHQLYPTVPILDWVKRNSSGKNTIKFHTLEESGNQGWWIQRRHVDSASYKVVSPIILGWMDSPEGHQYEFTDETSDSSQSYYYRIAQLNVTGYVTFVSDSIVMSKVTGVLEENMTPENIFLHQNYPNPFNPSTTLRYSLPSSSEVLIAVSDILGRKVSVLEEGIKSAGYHEIIWDAHALPSGIYFAEIFVNGNSAGRIKMLLVK